MYQQADGKSQGLQRALEFLFLSDPHHSSPTDFFPKELDTLPISLIIITDKFLTVSSLAWNIYRKKTLIKNLNIKWSCTIEIF